ncbi:hypothetical protein BBO99_00004991 [Phytophthora kernoviae]|uniref:HSF-type DNA-binding domain-containing protein n=1 Tax=Phytophthora kernoviae TaxID=325452 RepID=A0A3R7GU48_9STRA|nr:hypothetical protein BBI17_004398 [Phytophthora kernoviae]RLN79826.1 hypothetical protein BBO99_00004991 [Phytophthora kernoviae]
MVAEECGDRIDSTQRTEMKQADGLPSLVNGDAAKRRGVKQGLAGEEEPTPVVKSDPEMQQPPPTNWNLATIKEGGKRSKPEAPKFLLLLYEILRVEDSSVIRWSEDGLAVQILDPMVVTEKILPKYFNHTNFHSFQRQLNYFGFRKWTKSKTDICTFSHHYFRQDQPELLQVIKRKKAPRRNASNTANNKSTPKAGAANQAPKKMQSLSPCGKRKLPTDSSSEGFSTQSTGMHIQMSASAVPIQPAINGMALGAITTPHGASPSGALGFSSQDGLTRQYLPGSALLNNVISPVAATECKKKAKKMVKKEYLASTALHAPITSPTDTPKSLINSSSGPSVNVMGLMQSSPATNGNSSCVGSSASTSQTGVYNAASLPTLDIVRNRIIRRQQAGGADQQPQQVIQQQCDYNSFPGFAVPNGPQGINVPIFENRPESLLQTVPMSRMSSGEGTDVGTGQANDQNENLASLHNILLSNSLYTHRLEAQLKFIGEENEALKHMLEAKQREVDTLQTERKVLQHENTVLLEDKNKLFEINRDLLGKLFPQ